MASKVLSRGLVLAAIAGLVVLGLIFALLPSRIEARHNIRREAPPYDVSADAGQLHEELLIADLHADALLWDRDLTQRSDRGHVDIPRLIDGNVALQAFTVVTQIPRGRNLDHNDDRSDLISLLALVQLWPPRTWWSLRERALHQARKLERFADSSAGTLSIIKTTDDLLRHLERRAREPEITAAILGIEGAHALEGDLRNVEVLFDAGYRMIGLTHFFDNEVGGSAHGIEKGGLTAFGRLVVRTMEELGMVVDLAHASPDPIDDVLDVATKPVVVSHGGVRGTCDNSRNLQDRHLLRIAESGGVIGIGFWPNAVCGSDVSAIARAIFYAVDLVGAEHVALGSDFDGAVETPFDATGLALITEALLLEGLSADQLAQIMGENVIRLLSGTLPET